MMTGSVGLAALTVLVGLAALAVEVGVGAAAELGVDAAEAAVGASVMPFADVLLKLFATLFIAS